MYLENTYAALHRCRPRVGICHTRIQIPRGPHLHAVEGLRGWRRFQTCSYFTHLTFAATGFYFICKTLQQISRLSRLLYIADGMIKCLYPSFFISQPCPPHPQHVH